MNWSAAFRFPLALLGRLTEMFIKARALQREYAFAAVSTKACPTPRGRGGSGEAVSASPDAPASPRPTQAEQLIIATAAAGFVLHSWDIKRDDAGVDRLTAHFTAIPQT